MSAGVSLGWWLPIEIVELLVLGLMAHVLSTVWTESKSMTEVLGRLKQDTNMIAADHAASVEMLLRKHLELVAIVDNQEKRLDLISGRERHLMAEFRDGAQASSRDLLSAIESGASLSSSQWHGVSMLIGDIQERLSKIEMRLGIDGASS